MSSHTINSWKKYCLYHKGAIEDLRMRAISNAEKKAASKDKDMTDVAGTEASETTLPAAQQDTPQRDTSQQPISRQVTQQPISRQATPQQAISRQATPQQPVSQQVVPQQSVLHQATHQRASPQQPTNAPESQSPPPPYEKVANQEPMVVIKTEPLDEDQLDFAFAVDILSGWNADEESDAALWKRMESTVRVLVFSSFFDG